MATSSLFKVDVFEAADSLVPGKIKWLRYTPITCEDLIGLEDAGSCHFDSIKPLDKGKSLTRPCL